MFIMKTVHEVAESFLAAFKEAGAKVWPDAAGNEISHSTNRHGERSSYFVVEGHVIRVSDHSANQNFRVNETTVHFERATPERAREMLAEMLAAQAEADQKAAKKRAARDAYEAPFIAEFRAVSKDHLRQEIIERAINGMAHHVDVHERKQMWSRFRG